MDWSNNMLESYNYEEQISDRLAAAYTEIERLEKIIIELTELDELEMGDTSLLPTEHPVAKALEVKYVVMNRNKLI